ncbi:MAG: tetratricopeptide repeat protein [Spirosomataceae bacterium]
MSRSFCFLLFFFWFGVPLYSFSQTTKIDSLKKVLASLPPEGRSFASDTARVMVLCELGKAIQNDKIAAPFLKQAYQIAKKTKWLEGEYQSLFQLGKTYNRNGRYSEAIVLFYKSLFILEETKQVKKQAICLRDIGDAYLLLKKYDKAILYYQKSIDIFKKLREYKEYIDSLNNLALVYYSKLEYDYALKLFFECKKYENLVKGTLMEASYLSNIASCYREKKDFTRSLYYFDLALVIYNNNTNKYNNILGITLVEKAKVYYELGNTLKAIDLANTAYKLNNQYNGNNQFVNELLAQLYEKSGNYLKAYNHYKEFISAKDLSQKQDKEQQIEALKFEYANKQQKNQINLLNKNLETQIYQRSLFGLGFIFILIFSSIIFWNNRVLNIKNKQIELQSFELTTLTSQLVKSNSTLEARVNERTKELIEKNNELLQKNREIKEALFNGQSIERKRVASELHDNLGSTLSGLIWQLESIAIENMTPTEQYIYESLILKMRDAYTEIRHISHNMLPYELEKYGLENAIRKLINDLNQNNKIKFSLDAKLPTTISNKKVELELYSICMELLTNVLKHSNATQVQINLLLIDKSVTLEVCDNGKGFISDDIRTGKGMKNIKNRVDSVSGELTIESVAHQKTSIKIEVSFKE